MKSPFNFEITAEGKLSMNFLQHHISDFAAAMDFIRQLPYGRNKNKKDLITLFKDQCGTCGTKHAVLKELADENGYHHVKLMLGIYKMNGRNSPRVLNVLAKANLDYIPEAHNYLKIDDEIIDCTFPNTTGNAFSHDLLKEIEIQPGQITDFKVAFHQAYLKEWLKEQSLSLSPEELWATREDCIAALSHSYHP